MLEYQGIGRYRGKWCAIVRDGKQRKRLSTGLAATPENRARAERAGREYIHTLNQQATETVADIFAAYMADSQAISKDRAEYAWKRLAPHFGDLRPAQITRHACRQYVGKRALQGVKPGTIRRELVTLAAAIHWHDPQTPAVFEMPASPPPKDRWLTRDEFQRLLDASKKVPHCHLFMHLGIATGARKEALLTLKWFQVDFTQGVIRLGIKPGGKARATVPMTDTLRAELEIAKAGAQTEYVIEYNSRPVGSIKRAFNRAADDAGLPDVTPHTLRHTAAVWMAAAGVPLWKIAQYLGHSDSRTTEKIYARFAPDHLRDAADSLEVK